MGNENIALEWFRRLVLLGVVSNCLVAGFALINPEAVIELLKLEPSTPLIWPRFAAFLVILLSLFYIPGARNPVGLRMQAWYNVVCRAGGVVFFLVAGGPYLVLALYDAVIGVPQGLLLWRGLNDSKQAVQ